MQGRCSNFVLHGSILHFNGYSALSSLMPCPFTGPKMFWAGPNFIYILWQSQTFCARQKDDLHSVKLFFFAGTKVFEEALMPCPFTGPKMVCAGPNFLSQTKNLTPFSASSKTFVPARKPNFTEFKPSFCLAQNVCDFHNL